MVILAGAIIGSTYGYRDSEFTIAEGETLPVAAEAGLSIKLIDFTDTYYAETGAPSDYASQVVLYKDGNEVERHTIRVNDPLRHGDTTFYQAFFGSAAVMTVKDDKGNTLVSQGVPMAWRTTDDNRAIGSFSIPGTDYVGWVIGTLGSGDTRIKPGQMELDLYTAAGGALTASKVLDQGTATTVGGLTVTFDRESQFTGLNVARDPGVLLVWLGCLPAVLRLRHPLHGPAQAAVGTDHYPAKWRGGALDGEPGAPGGGARYRVRQPDERHSHGAAGARTGLREITPWQRCPTTR